MIKQLFLYFLLSVLIVPQVLAQGKNATLKGVLKDKNGKPLDIVQIAMKDFPLGTSTNRNGEFLLRIPAEKSIILVYRLLGYKTIYDTVFAHADETIRREIKLDEEEQLIDEISVRGRRFDKSNITHIDPKFVNLIPNASGAFETLLKTLPGVSSNNELSSQYSVRGGNFDENLVYVNDVEVYRPMLIRAGQQEGLSFINSDMVSTVEFSSGGFNAKYDDKMSSVLDIKYRKPSDFRGSASASLLGATAHFEDVSLKGKLSHITGFRYKTNRYLLNSLNQQGSYDPRFLDFQTYITYQFSEKFDISFLGNVARNEYRFIPKSSSITFGTWQTPLNTKIYFEGQEVDDFQTYLGALTFNYHPAQNFSMKFIVSAYNAFEKETFDIVGQYYLNELERNMSSEQFGDSVMNIGVGTFINHARNRLDAKVIGFSHKGALDLENHLLNWGFKLQNENIVNRINEWTYRDSAGYSLPYSDSKVNLFYTFRNSNQLTSNRITAYFQDTYLIPSGWGNFYLTGGIRVNYWDFNNEFLVVPRTTISFYPDWKRRISFRFSAGMYHQSPFFKELINNNGTLNQNARAQRSFQMVAGSDLVFTAWDRPFRFTSEAYYKWMTRLIPYDIDNVRIRYLTELEANGYARGIDFNINGEFVSGLQSWASLSFMQTKEDIKGDSKGYIPRPTDQRVNFSLFFQDYLPGNPTYKVQLSGFYGTRLPAGPPNSIEYRNIFRMPPYRRIDLGISKTLIGPSNDKKSKLYRHINEMAVSMEVLNLLGINNTISYFWVSSIYGDKVAVPNYLTKRILNLKLTIKF